jgi:hypothetical protein
MGRPSGHGKRIGEVAPLGVSIAISPLTPPRVCTHHKGDFVMTRFSALVRLYRPRAEINEKQARSIKYQLIIAKLPLAKDLDDFQFEGAPINQTLVNELAGESSSPSSAMPC